MPEPDLYDLLGVSPDATDEEIRAAYRRAASEWHPDRNQSAAASARMSLLNVARDTLVSPGRRAEYDRRRSGLVAGAPAYTSAAEEAARRQERSQRRIREYVEDQLAQGAERKALVGKLVRAGMDRQTAFDMVQDARQSIPLTGGKDLLWGGLLFGGGVIAAVPAAAAGSFAVVIAVGAVAYGGFRLSRAFAARLGG